jgi:fido (protein-threonine AMPylation protein)
VGGAFDASPAFGDDELVTADEIQASGQQVLRVLSEVATSAEPWPVDFNLLKEIHFRWFETTFPADAGEFRTEMVLNRKGTAVEVEAILPAIHNACENWNWRQENMSPADEVELIEFLVVESNTLVVGIYDIHPFIDGNTRVTWHLRNYVLMLGGLPPLNDPADPGTYDTAWWAATVAEHAALDQAVLAELGRQESDRRRLSPAAPRRSESSRRRRR